MNQSEFLRAAARGEDMCPTVEEWSAFAAGETQASAAALYDAHRKACAACEAELSALQQFLSASPSAAEADDVRWIRARVDEHFAPPQTAPWWKFVMSPSFALAAVAVIAAGIGYRTLNPSQPVLTTTGIGELRATGTIEFETEGGEVSALPEEIRWKAVPGAALYKVEIVGVDGEVLHTAQSTESLLRTDTVQNYLPAHAARIIRVTANGISGELRIRLQPR